MIVWIIMGSVLGAACMLGLAWFGIPLALRMLQCRALESRCRTDRLIALTFDDGPSPDVTPDVLDLLDEMDVKATFFMVGNNVAKHPEIAAEVRKRGHEVAAHSMHHLDAWRVSPRRGMRDVSLGVDIMVERALHPNLFRPPRGRATIGSFYQSLKSGCRPFWWTHDSGDSGYRSGRSKLSVGRFLKNGTQTSLTKEQIDDKLQPASREGWVREVAEQGGVVLLHDAPRDHPELISLTLDATRDLVRESREHGTRFVCASELR